MGILSGHPKDEPMHYGEVYNVWQASMVAKGIASCYSAYVNHAGDNDLKNVLQDLIAQAKQESSELDDILMENGLTPSPSLPDKPPVKLEDIPAGARFSDMEIAAAISADTAVGLVACSQAMAQCIREDIGVLFGKYHLAKVKLGNRILQMNKEKGWLVPPPLQLKRPEPVKA